MRTKTRTAVALLAALACPALAAGDIGDRPAATGGALQRTRMAVLDESDRIEVQISRTRERLRERVRAFYRVVRAGSGRGAGRGVIDDRVRAELARRALASDLRALRSATDRARALDDLRDRLRRDVAARPAAPPPEPIEPPLAETLEPDGDELPDFVVAQSSGTLTVHGAPPTPFASLRGELPMPVRGSSSLQARRRDDGQVELSVGPAAVAQAVAPGRVAFAGDYAGLGKIVILDHGGPWHTVTGGLVTLSVSRGMQVRPGDALGVASSMVVFEVRQGGRTLDGLTWLGLR